MAVCYLLYDGADCLFLDVLTAFGHQEAVLDVQFFHLLEDLLMLGICLVLFLADLLDDLGQEAILVEENPFIGGQKKSLIHLEEFEVGVQVVVEILGQLVAIAVKAELPLVDLEHGIVHRRGCAHQVIDWLLLLQAFEVALFPRPNQLPKADEVERHDA